MTSFEYIKFCEVYRERDEMKLVTTGPGAARPDGVIFAMLEVGQVEISWNVITQLLVGLIARMMLQLHRPFADLGSSWAVSHGLHKGAEPSFEYETDAEAIF